MTVRSCEMDGCTLPARWARVSDSNAANYPILCTDHWRELQSADVMAAVAYYPIHASIPIQAVVLAPQTAEPPVV